MSQKLSGKTALITGASAGISRASAPALGGVILMACTQSPRPRIIEVQMRTPYEPLT